jgi:outer membrane protein
VKHRAGTITLSGKCVLLAALATPSAFAPVAAQTPAQAAVASQPIATKIGYIDVKRIIDNAPQFVESAAKLRRDFASRDAQIQADDAKLAELKQRYERDNAIMTHDDAEALKRKIDATERDNKRQRDEARAEYGERGKIETNRNFLLINDTAIEYARAQGYDMVIGSQAALFASPRVDITDGVLQRLKQINSAAPKP